MFKSLQSFIPTGGSISLLLKDVGNGLLSVVVMPTKENGHDKAMAQPLVLKGTPEELDAEFVELITNYQAARVSLKDQADATTAILKTAEKQQSDKAVKKLKGKSSGEVQNSGDDNTDDDLPEPGAGAAIEASSSTLTADNQSKSQDSGLTNLTELL